jgi:hypothetical protein
LKAAANIIGEKLKIENIDQAIITCCPIQKLTFG